MILGVACVRHLLRRDRSRPESSQGRDEHAALWLRSGPGDDGREFVFATPDGAPLSPATVTRRFGKLAEKLKLPTLTVHGLPHSYATVALALACCRKSYGVPAFPPGVARWSPLDSHRPCVGFRIRSDALGRRGRESRSSAVTVLFGSGSPPISRQLGPVRLVIRDPLTASSGMFPTLPAGLMLSG